MPSSYTSTGIELIADGEQSGSWGETTNTSLEIINRLTSEAGTISLSGTTHTLSLSDGVLSDGHYAVLVFGGAPSGTNTVTISPSDAKRVFILKNSSGETVTMTQGSGGNVSVANGSVAIVYCDGGGSGAEVVDVSSSFLRSENNLSDLDDAETALTNLGLTATAAELNIMDGVTSDTAELNILDGVTATADDLNILVGAATGAQSTGAGVVPQGGIIMWSGTIANVPSGWGLCDGTNGTPDLTGKFVVHADADTGGTYAPGDTGGADDVTLTIDEMPAHDHGGNTSTDGAHRHSYRESKTNNKLTDISVGQQVNQGSSLSNTSQDGNHNHTITSQGGGTAHENRPPYYALAYIMKL